MKYTHFDNIANNNRTEFAMLYFVAMRTMRKLETASVKTIIGLQARLLPHFHRKLTQMVARHKAM